MKSRPIALELALAGYVVLVLAWAVTGSGLVRVVGELELETFGSYSPGSVVLALLVPAFFVHRHLGVTYAALRVQPGSPRAWMQNLFVPFLIAALGVAFSAAFFVDALAPEVGAVPIDELANVGKSSFYADVSGFPDDANAVATQDGAGARFLYKPFRRYGGPRRATEVVVEVRADEVRDKIVWSKTTSDSADVHGRVDRRLPDSVRLGLARRGVALADDVWVVHSHASKAGALPVALLVLGASMVGAIFKLRANRNARALRDPRRARIGGASERLL